MTEETIQFDKAEEKGITGICGLVCGVLLAFTVNLIDGCNKPQPMLVGKSTKTISVKPAVQ